ncbi:efflux RND transporter periplasmic adaptor subunit [Halopseudomonas salegens]|uniref:Membrane fusion protein, macrolide-specific efflux system n=1 Tax=Halopseudomonas salegens TaxID=1434072 RepID=A0A1H2GAM0_9GAMM|nr:efflux RND transporter periplasmic adaptor subunit [Halopseudomonas salegens]SDU16521.1 membrane fusion protein, macrolide-specific efflux system [Halopseudomonas salegens]
MSASRRSYWWLLLLLLVGALLVAGYLWHANQQNTPQYTTASVTRGDVEDSITALGTLEPLNSVDVGTQVSGQLKQLHVEPGDQVSEGDLLAEIDSTIYLARVEASTAQLANQRAQLTDRRAQQTLARLQAERQRELFALDATSEEALQTAEATLLSANAQIEALQAQIRQTESGLKGDQADLNYTRIYAPMAGTVVEQFANQGQTLNANQTAPVVVQIADLATMTVRTQVSEADISRIEPGMPVYFSTLGQPQRRWESSLRQILPTPEIINNVVLFNALFDVPNPDNELLPKMSAQVFFVRAAAEDVLTVPIAALQPLPNADSRDRFRVRVLHQGAVEEREVRTGVRTRVVAEILEGLSEGEQVITSQPLDAASGSEGMPRRMR